MNLYQKGSPLSRLPRTDKKKNSLERLSHDLCHREFTEDYMSDHLFRQAYKDYYHEQSLEKSRSLMHEVLKNDSFGEILRNLPVVNILDIGTGTGGFAQGIIETIDDYFPTNIQMNLQDRSALALSYAAKELSELPITRKPSFQLLQGILPDEFPCVGPIHLLSWGNLLTEWEWSSSLSQRFLEKIDRSLANNGLLVIAEPADRQSSRLLHQFSDDLLRSFPSYRILAPCPNDRRSTCPALNNASDWCHEDRPHRYSDKLRETAKTLGHIKDSLKMSYLICQKQTSRTQEIPPPHHSYPHTRYKMVADMSHERGLSRSVFCDGSRWISYRLLRRYKNEENRDFFHLRKGQYVTISFSNPPALKGTAFDIPPGSVIHSERQITGSDDPDSDNHDISSES